MSTPQIIYNNILNSDNFSGDISPDTQEYHKSIINIFLNYQSGSTTVNLWDKLDFFYFFDTDNESLRYINWKDSNLPTASLGNDTFPSSYNYSYLGPSQDQIAKWWDGKSTPFGNKSSVFGNQTLSYAWSSSIPQIPIQLSTPSGSNSTGIKQYTLNGYVPTVGTGSLPDTYVNTLTQTFDYYPFTSSYSYKYEVLNYFWFTSGSSYSELRPYNNSLNNLQFNNINGDTSTYTGSINFLNTRTNSVVSAISVQVLQNPLRHRITITPPTSPPSTGIPVSSVVNTYDTFNSRRTNPFNIGYNTTFRSAIASSNPNIPDGLYYMSLFQDWVLNNNYLPGIIRYPNYYQVLQLNNGTYFNTNFNIKQSSTNYSLNDGFIGFLKMGLGGGVGINNNAVGATQSGSLYMGVAESEISNNSLAIKINKQYFTSSVLDTGYQSGLGLALNSSTGTKDYTWAAYTGSNPYPYSSSAPGNQDFPGTNVTASNASSRAGRPGLYISQRSLSQGNVLIRQYYNNLLASSQSFSSITGSIPDGNFLLNGLGSPTYVDSNYVAATTIQFVTKSLATITSVSTGSFFGTASYSLLGQISSVQEVFTNVLTYFTGSYNSQTGVGVNGYFSSLPSTLTNGNQFSIVFSNNNNQTNFSLPQVNDFIHIGYGDNQIGYVTSVDKDYENADSNVFNYTIIATATKTTGSGINNGNSTIVRFYEDNRIDIGSAFNSTTRETLYNTIISGSALSNTSSFLNQVFALSPQNNQVVKYPFGGTNGLPTQSLTFTIGSELGFSISSSISLYPEVGPGVGGWKLSTPSGSLIYSGSEFGVTYFTNFTGSYVTSSNDLETIFITNAAGNTVYDNNYFLTNGTYYLPEPSVSGSSFQFRYSSSIQTSQLSGLSTSNLFKITTLNSEFGSSYFTPNGGDLKTYNRQSDSFMMAFAGGGINNTNLRFLYKQLYDVIYARGQYKATEIPILNFNSSSNLPASTVNYPDGVDTTDEKLRWYAATDVQEDFVGTIRSFGDQLFNPFSFTGNLYDSDI
jgi:hypothetical protein